MKPIFRIVAVCIALVFIAWACSDSGGERIERVVRAQLAEYPESRLQDVYKNFFHDAFGPGHLAPDRESAERYLRDELASYDSSVGREWEPAGAGRNFVRVNLDVVKSGKVPFDAMLDAFLDSARDFEQPGLGEWLEEWERITEVIEKKHIAIVSYDEDKAQIAKMLTEGKYVLSHSEVYKAHYRPHYRLVGNDVFESVLSRYL